MRKDKYGLMLLNYFKILQIIVLLGFLSYAIPDLYRQHQENEKWRQEIDERIRQYNLKHGTSINGKDQDSFIQGR